MQQRTWGWVLAWAVGGSASGATPELTLLVPHAPGLVNRSEGAPKPQGPAIAMARRLIQEAGVAGRFVEAPLARGLLDARTTPLTCVIGVPRSPSLEGNYRWFGPIARTRLVVLTRPGPTARLGSPRDLRGKTLVVSRASAPDHLLAELDLPATRVGDNAAAYRMLLRGHADYWVTNELVATKLVQELGGERLALALVVQALENHLACHRGLPDAVAERLGKAVGTLKVEGVLAPFGIE